MKVGTIKDVLKGKKIIIYARVSTTKQKKTLPSQVESIKKLLKAEGVKQSQIIGTFSEVGKGTLEREGLDEALALARKQKKPVAIVFRDVQRFARNAFHLGWMIYPFMRENITFVDLLAGRATSTMKDKRIDDDLMTVIVSAIGGKESDTTDQRSREARKLAAEKGIISDRVDLMPKWELNPMRFMHERLKEGVSVRGIADMMPVKSKESIRKRIAIIKRAKDALNAQELKEWFETMDIIREFEAEHGPRYGGDQTKRMNAIGRMTSGYLSFPEKYLKPTREDIQFYFDNFKDFQPKKKKTRN